MGRHVLKLMDLVDEEKKKGFLLSSHTSCMLDQGLGPSVYFSDHLLRNLLSFLPACPWDSSVGAFGGSLRVSPFYMCRTPRSARGEPPPAFLG